MPAPNVFNTVYDHEDGFKLLYDSNVVSVSVLNDILMHLKEASYAPHWLDAEGCGQERIVIILKCLDAPVTSALHVSSSASSSSTRDDIFVLVAWRIRPRNAGGGGLAMDDILTLRDGSNGLLACSLLLHCSTHAARVSLQQMLGKCLSYSDFLVASLSNPAGIMLHVRAALLSNT